MVKSYHQLEFKSDLHLVEYHQQELGGKIIPQILMMFEDELLQM